MTRFGPSGNDEKFYEEGHKSSLEAPAWLHGMGLTALEINFGRGVRMKSETGAKLGEEARKYNVSISAHAPYYINLASGDVEKSYQYIATCIKMLTAINSSDGPNRLVVHVGSQKDLGREDAMANCRKNLKFVVDKLHEDGYSNFLLCIETMGRYKAIGTIEEICDLCEVADCIVPTIDFGHINAWEQGSIKRDPNRIREIVEYTTRRIGEKPFHIHFQPVIFGKNGEHSHTHLEDEKWAFPFEPLAKILKEKKLEPVIISESASQMARDAFKMMKIYQKIV